MAEIRVETRRGPGIVFWIIIIAILALVGWFAWAYFGGGELLGSLPEPASAVAFLTSG
jgi:hypothetical protein